MTKPQEHLLDGQSEDALPKYRFVRTLFGDDFATAVPGWVCHTEQAVYRLRVMTQTNGANTSSYYLLKVTLKAPNYEMPCDDWWCRSLPLLKERLNDEYEEAEWEVE